MTADRPAGALIGFGSVRHTRLRPRRHAFAYPVYFLLLPLRSLRARPDTALPRNRFAPIAFHDCDHGDGRADALAWFDDLLASEGVHDADGEVWLHTFPRVLGYAFKPVSFWFALRRDGSLGAVVAEVNNTFRERHCYLLHGDGLAWGREVSAVKVFHVSPFCETAGRYRFRFLRVAHPAGGLARMHAGATDHLIARVDHDDAGGPLLATSISGALHLLDRAQLRRAFWGMPLMTLGVIARIHWQALRLWLQRVPWFGKPRPPAAFVSRSRP